MAERKSSAKSGGMMARATGREKEQPKSKAKAPSVTSDTAPAPPKKMTSAKVDKYKTSQTLNAEKKCKTALSASYMRGSVPCRINHGSVRSTLQWDTPLDSLSYDPLLIQMAEGLQELEHPFVFIARQGFKEMIKAPGAKEKVLPIVGNIIAHIRNALRNKNNDIFIASCDALRDLAALIGEAIQPHIANLVMPLSARISQKECSQCVNETLQTLADSGGPQAIATIKGKIPTFSSM